MLLDKNKSLNKYIQEKGITQLIQKYINFRLDEAFEIAWPIQKKLCCNQSSLLDGCTATDVIIYILTDNYFLIYEYEFWCEDKFFLISYNYLKNYTSY